MREVSAIYCAANVDQKAGRRDGVWWARVKERPAASARSLTHFTCFLARELSRSAPADHPNPPPIKKSYAVGIPSRQRRSRYIRHILFASCTAALIAPFSNNSARSPGAGSFLESTARCITTQQNTTNLPGPKIAKASHWLLNDIQPRHRPNHDITTHANMIPCY